MGLFPQDNEELYATLTALEGTQRAGPNFTIRFQGLPIVPVPFHSVQTPDNHEFDDLGFEAYAGLADEATPSTPLEYIFFDSIAVLSPAVPA